MKKYCTEHRFTEALSICHSCGLDYCESCLTEGKEYYYCKKPECQKLLKDELGDEQLQNIEPPHDDDVNLVEVYESRDSGNTAILKSIFDNAKIEYCTYGENYGKYRGVIFVVSDKQLEEAKKLIKELE